jgi:hypothetical protein
MSIGVDIPTSVSRPVVDDNDDKEKEEDKPEVNDDEWSPWFWGKWGDFKEWFDDVTPWAPTRR